MPLPSSERPKYRTGRSFRGPRWILCDLGLGISLAIALFHPEARAQPYPTENISLYQYRGKGVEDYESGRLSSTGHKTNYDENRVGNYQLPDPLVLRNGDHVTNQQMWLNRRRPELLALYRFCVYGRVPSTAPAVTFTVVQQDLVLDKHVLRKIVMAKFGTGEDSLSTPLLLYFPAHASGPVPVILGLVFGDVFKNSNSGAVDVPAMLARGYGVALFKPMAIQPDNETSKRSGVIRLAFKPGQTATAPDEWGAISVWAWSASRILDYLEHDPLADAKRVAIYGHSRLAKTALWAGAQDPRFALVFASAGGKAGPALWARDYGEMVDDEVDRSFFWFADNFRRFRGHANQLPVDGHILIALNAPHPIFNTGSTLDPWADPRGEFLGALAASPVYRLFGKEGLGTNKFPETNEAAVSGNLGFYFRAGSHDQTAAEWPVFGTFADKYFR
jgi:hypothetical protein